eukprot:gene20209-22185_t
MTSESEAAVKELIWITLSCLVMLLNLVEVVTLARKHACLKPYEKLLLSLAFSDLLVAVSVLVYKICDYLIALNNWLKEESFSLFLIFSMIISIGNSFVIAGDRFLAVKYPIKHRTWITNRKMNRAIIILWVVCLVIIAAEYTSIIVAYPNAMRYSAVVSSVLLLLYGVVVTIIYVYIFNLSTSKSAKMNPTAIRARNNLQNSASFKRPWNDKERRIFYTCFLVTFSYVICSYPFSIEFLIIKDANKVSLTTRLILFLNSAINPVIYFLKGYGERRRQNAANNVACVSMHTMAA